MQARELTQALRMFTGTENYHRHPMYTAPLYTDGVLFFLQNAGQGAYWLLDILATEPAIRLQAQEFAHVLLCVTGSSALLSVTDGNGSAPVYRRDVSFTDCPEGDWGFYWTDGILMLPKEY